jgi:hypothetical protein
VAARSRGQRLRKVTGWGSTKRLTGLFDLAVKGAALLAAFAAATFFQQPDVVFVPVENDSQKLQTFVDVNALQDEYIAVGRQVPDLVQETARTYDAHNQVELVTGGNVRQYSPELLCREARVTVLRLFPEANCDVADPYLGGRGRSYEGLLLQLNLQAGEPLTTAGLQEGLRRLRDAEYLVVRYVIENRGNGYAKNVQVLPPEQFESSGLVPIALAPGERYAIRFESERGAVERTPTPEQLTTLVSWDKGAGVLSGVSRIALWVLFVLFIVSLAWALIEEIAGYVSGGREPTPDGGQRQPP